MQLVVEINPKNAAAVIAALVKAGAVKTRGRPAKTDKEPEVDEDAEDETEEDEEADETEDDADEGMEEDEEGGDDEEADEEKEEKAAKGKPKTATIVKAFQDYAKRHSRAKAKKILDKFKAKNVRELPAAKYPLILKMLAK